MKDQKSPHWEWVVVVNGGASKDEIETLAGGDPRVRVVMAGQSAEPKIGALKKMGFMAATGEILAELDHDDFIDPGMTEELSKAFTDPTVSFAYTHCAEFHHGHHGYDDYSPVIYGAQYGWQYRGFTMAGKQWQEAVAFDPSPASLQLIYYAPNHIRAWRADFYRQIGGHNEEMKVLDDQELLIRTYLFGKMVKIPKCLYFYRVHGENSWLRFNGEIQAGTRHLQDRYLVPLVERWADLGGHRKIDLGGRFACPPGYISVDQKGPAAILADLTKRYPFDDDSVGVIRASDFVEHVADVEHTMREIHRVLAPGGFVIIDVPSTDGRGAWQDPTHVSFWNENRLWYWTRREQAKFIDNRDVRFQTLQLKTWFPNDWCRQHNIPYVRFVGAALKPGAPRYPGLIEI